LGDITTFWKLFSQTDKKLLKKLPLEIMFGVVFWFWLGNSMTHTKIVEFLIIYLTPQVRDNLYVVVVIF
jgi:hypothetical protein